MVLIKIDTTLVSGLRLRKVVLTIDREPPTSADLGSEDTNHYSTSDYISF